VVASDTAMPSESHDERGTARGQWPASSAQMTVAAEIVLAAGHAAFSDGQRERFHALCRATSPTDWNTVFQVAGLHNMRALLWSHLAQEGFSSLVEPDLWETARDEYRNQLLSLMRLVVTLREALAACAAAGIRAMPRKGPALALRVYSVLGPRPSRDLDLLIDAGASQRRVYRRLRPLFDKWEARGIRVELAWSPIHRLAYRATFDPKALWQRATPTTFRGIPCFALHPRDELRYLCVHHIIHHNAAEWLWLVDIAELLRQYTADPTWDWPSFVAECIASQTALPVLLAFIQAHALLDAPFPSEAAIALDRAVQSDAEQSRWQATNMPVDSMQGALALLHSTGDLSEFQQVLRTLIWPERTHLREYYNWVPGQPATPIRLHRLQRIIHEIFQGRKHRRGN
jgi:hypothetical protein